MDEDFLTLDSFLNIVRDRSWMTRAACRGMDPDMFFPERGSNNKDGKTANELINTFKPICETCPVQNECGDYGMPEVYGFWGGVSPMKRRAERVRRNKGEEPRDLVDLYFGK